jgi:hypothetical protein
MATKIIVTIKANLMTKYKLQFDALEKLFTLLINSDNKKGISTQLVYLDDQMQDASEKACKDAIDELFTAHRPDYLMIFGAQDVVPFQNLVNPLFSPETDDDKFIPSDLPYACESGYSTDCNAFTSPSRVVGRLPDLPVSGNIKYVKTLINNSIKAKPASSKYPVDYFAVTASVWEKSTEQSINNIFGNIKTLISSPPAKGKYTADQLRPAFHFYNCHGSLNDTNYYGQKASSYPVALSAADLDHKITSGTIVAAECCFGAQLFDEGEYGISIASNYLGNNALSFMGSSTIAYGPADGQGLADLICQYYMININKGASAGRALLEARQQFLTESAPDLDPYELKTLAQFYILGDPSLQIIKPIPTKSTFNTIENRRFNLASKGANLGAGISKTIKVEEHPAASNYNEILSILQKEDFRNQEREIVFEVEGLKSELFSKKLNLMGIADEDSKVRFRVYQKEVYIKAPVRNIKTLVIKEVNNQVLGWKTYVSR